MLSRDTSAHAQRVQLLDDLAVLAGFPLRYKFRLPDGRQPDVFRVDVARHRIFIGDGKKTETPGCTATGARLHSYFIWLRTHVAVRDNGAVFAICFGNPAHRGAWVETAAMLAH